MITKEKTACDYTPKSPATPQCIDDYLSRWRNTESDDIVKAARKDTSKYCRRQMEALNTLSTGPEDVVTMASVFEWAIPHAEGFLAGWKSLSDRLCKLMIG
jgi:hypothetical protein